MQELPKVLRAMWGLETGSRRGPRPTLTLGTITSAAVRVADAEGFAAVSMTRVAAELGVTTMALYRYVTSKEDLVAAMVDAAAGALPDPREEPAGWRTRLARWCDAYRVVLTAHPWVLHLPMPSPPLGPNQTAWMELGLRAFDGTALSMQERLDCLLLANVYVRGQLQLGLDLVSSGGDDFGVAWVATLRRLVTPESHPQVARALGSGALEDEGGDFTVDSFRFGVERVLDGIAALVEQRGTDQARPSPG